MLSILLIQNLCVSHYAAHQCIPPKYSLFLVIQSLSFLKPSRQSIPCAVMYMTWILPWGQSYCQQTTRIRPWTRRHMDSGSYRRDGQVHTFMMASRHGQSQSMFLDPPYCSCSTGTAYLFDCLRHWRIKWACFLWLGIQRLRYCLYVYNCMLWWHY